MARQLLITLAVLASCTSSSYRLGPAIDRGNLDDDESTRHRKLVERGDKALAARDDEASVKAAIAAYQRALDIRDDDWRTYAKLSEGYYVLAESHLGFRAMGGGYPYRSKDVTDKKAGKAYRRNLLRGYRTALRGMAARSREFEARLRAGLDIDKAFNVLNADSAPLLYWYVSNLARWSQAEGYGQLFQQRNRIRGGIERLLAIAPTYRGGGPHRLAGIYYAIAPGAFGGDRERAARHFQTAAELGPGRLHNQLFWAEFLLSRTDKAAAGQKLVEILAADLGPPELVPDNRVAQRMARAIVTRSYQQLDLPDTRRENPPTP